MNVAFVGGMGAGKTTQARRVAKQYGLQMVSLAGGIKKIAKEYFGITNKAHPDARRIYQAIGDGGRRIDPCVWVRYAVKQIERSPHWGTVIDDLRRPNEADAFNHLGFFTVYLKVPLLERMRRIAARDYNSRLSISLGMKILRSMLHPSELVIPLAVRIAKKQGRLLVVNGNQAEEKVWQDVYEGLERLSRERFFSSRHGPWTVRFLCKTE